MAVPTISTVSPNTGPSAGGQLVVITGTNFKQLVLNYSVPQPTYVPTVSVTFGGRAARRVEVISATTVRCLTPRYWHHDPRADTFPAVDVVLKNLDASGTPIVGETATKTGGFTYARWALGAPTKDPAITRVSKELLLALALEVERNTYRATHIDYGEEGTAVLVDEAQLPSINVTLSEEDDPENGARDNYPEEVPKGDGTADLYTMARTVQLVANLLLAGGTAGEAERLVSAVQDFVQVNPLLTVSADPDLYPGEEDEYPVEISQQARQTGAPSDSGMIVYSMQLRVRGIMVLPSDPTMNVKTIETVTLTEQHMDRDGVDDGEATHKDLIP